MEQIKLIKTEIERRIEQLKEERSKIPSPTPESIITSLEVSLSMSSDKLSLGARIAALEEILVFINSLPSEEANKDLEEYYTKEFLPKEFFAKLGQRTISEFNFFTAKHFANWQKQRTIDKACEWLRKHVLEYFEDAGVEISTFTENFITAMEDEQ